MNPDEPITIKVDTSYLKEYFYFSGIHKHGTCWATDSISRKQYDQVKDLLSEYNIQDQQTIDNFCYLQMIFMGKSIYAREPGPDKEEESRKTYYSALSKFGEFLEANNITGIHFKGESKSTRAGQVDSISLNDPKFISEAIKGFSLLMNDYTFYKERGIFDREKRRPGAKVKTSGWIFREDFFCLLRFLNTLSFPELKELSETEENYFAGMLFYIAGIIKPFSEDTSYLSLRDYLVKTMQKYR